MRKLIATPDDTLLLFLRLVLGVVMFPHGAQKALGWFGGGGIGGTIGYMGSMGIPSWLAALVIAAEFLGAIGLIVGLLGRVAALGILCVMIGAVATTHLPNGFFMNWSGQAAGEGFEYHMLAAALAIAIIWRGSGAFSVDRALMERADAGPEAGYAAR